MYDFLTQPLPTKYKGLELNTSFRSALRAQEVLDDPRLVNGSQQDKLAAYYAAFLFIYKDANAALAELGLPGAIDGLSWWLSCGNNDSVENYWLRTRIMPDVDSNSFSLDDYNDPSDGMINIETVNPDGTRSLKQVSKYATLAFNAPDGTTRYARETRGDPALLSLYEDNRIIYSGFYKTFGIDLSSGELHWFVFSALLAELELTEGTALNSRIKTRSFDPDDYKGKAHAEYRAKMLKAKHESRVLGILPYIDREEG